MRGRDDSVHSVRTFLFLERFSDLAGAETTKGEARLPPSTDSTRSAGSKLARKCRFRLRDEFSKHRFVVHREIGQDLTI